MRKRDFRVMESHLLEECDFPIQAFFNAISDSKFTEVIGQMSLGIGRGINDAVCTFPGDLDPEEELFDGIQFSLYGWEPVIADYKKFYYYLSLACKAHIEDFPDDQNKIKEYADEISRKYQLSL